MDKRLFLDSKCNISDKKRSRNRIRYEFFIPLQKGEMP